MLIWCGNNSVSKHCASYHLKVLRVSSFDSSQHIHSLPRLWGRLLLQLYILLHCKYCFVALIFIPYVAINMQINNERIIFAFTVTPWFVVSKSYFPLSAQKNEFVFRVWITIPAAPKHEDAAFSPKFWKIVICDFNITVFCFCSYHYIASLISHFLAFLFLIDFIFISFFKIPFLDIWKIIFINSLHIGMNWLWVTDNAFSAKQREQTELFCSLLVQRDARYGLRWFVGLRGLDPQLLADSLLRVLSLSMKSWAGLSSLTMSAETRATTSRELADRCVSRH